MRVAGDSAFGLKGLGVSKDTHKDELSAQEIAERMDKALKRSFQMPHKPHEPTKPKNRTASKGRVRKGRSRS